MLKIFDFKRRREEKETREKQEKDRRKCIEKISQIEIPKEIHELEIALADARKMQAGMLFPALLFSRLDYSDNEHRDRKEIVSRMHDAGRGILFNIYDVLVYGGILKRSDYERALRLLEESARVLEGDVHARFQKERLHDLRGLDREYQSQILGSAA